MAINDGRNTPIGWLRSRPACTCFQVSISAVSRQGRRCRGLDEMNSPRALVRYLLAPIARTARDSTARSVTDAG